MISDEDSALPNSVAKELRSLIVRGTLLPGEHMGQTELANRFGRSKVPIREALKHLATEGFLLHDRNRGYFVAPIDYREADQLYRLRRWVEAELLKTARWPAKEELQDFQKQFDTLSKIDPDKDFEAWSGALEQLRYSIFDLSPQKMLLREAIRLWRLTDRYRYTFPRNVADSPERSLIEAFKEHDRDLLLTTYHAIRDKVESILYEVLHQQEQLEAER